MNVMFGIIGEIIFMIALLPTMMIFGTPFIFFLAFRSKKPYWDAVADGYHAVWNWWKKHPDGSIWSPFSTHKNEQSTDKNKRN